MALGSKSVLSGGVEQEIKQGFFLEFLLSPYLFDSQPEKVVVRVSLGLVWFGTFKEKIGRGGETPNHQPGKQSKPSALGFSSGKKMVSRKPPYSVQKSMQQLLLSLQLQHSSWPIVVTLKAATKDNPKSVIFFP